jgi:hypothetical protein|nr:MAG TPA: holin [Caudoviricetes sp.]
MNEFITWEMLGDFVKLTGIVLATTQFVKNAPLIKKIPTQYLSWLVSFVLITLFNIHTSNFTPMDIVLYALSAMFIGTSASGIYDVGGTSSDKIEKIATKVKDLMNGSSEDTK